MEYCRCRKSILQFTDYSGLRNIAFCAGISGEAGFNNILPYRINPCFPLYPVPDDSIRHGAVPFFGFVYKRRNIGGEAVIAAGKCVFMLPKSPGKLCHVKKITLYLL